jgi:hypothetical protein
MKAGATKSNDLARVLIHILLIATVGSFMRCAPLASEMQGARLTGKKQVEITPGYSSVQFAEEQPRTSEGVVRESTGKVMGIQLAYGVSEKVDFRARVEQITFRNVTTIVFAIGPKVSLVKNRVALYAPLWFVDFKPAQLQPCLLFTLPLVQNRIEFNPSVKSIMSVGGYDPNNGFMVAVNTGLAISNDARKWAVRPEFSFVYDVKRSCYYRSFSIGLSIRLSALKDL